MTPQITVSIVTYKTSLSLIQENIAALKTSTVPLEILIVDNSMDDAYFAQLQTESGVRCLQSPRNGGYGPGHNFAVKHLPAAPYHIILNPDAIIHQHCLETLVAFMEARPEAGLATPKIFFPDGTLQPLNKRDPNLIDLFIRRFIPHKLQKLPIIAQRMDHYIMMDHGYDTSYELEFASGCFMFFRRSVFDQIGGFDERYFMYMEDADLSRNARQVAKVMYCPEAYITHYWARATHTNVRMLLVFFKSAYLYFSKWGWA